ncbi:FAD-binding oxidoreductase [Sphingobium sp. EM0848]|uniref:FAD-binding oxidoreductase n=1 Tax=Sphingobium sp. EM0848 TaxID=2743473 RepID=UPI00159C11CA|nr:FAD-binding oxidoreductase [Sphingobium sp. EM0848]
MSDSALIEALRDIVGKAHVLTDCDELAGYRTDGRGSGGGHPVAVVRPADAAAICEMIRLAMAWDIRIVVQGGRTGLVGAGLPSDRGGELIINLERLSRHVEIDPANRTACVDAGVRLSALNAAAASHGLFLPIDLGADPTIGGMIASNTGGARLLRHGDMRANLLTLDVVRAAPQPEVLTLGLPLWKNNTGLDLKHLLVGSGGSLGIVTRATVTLQPLPAAQTTALVALRDADAALPILQAAEAAFGGLLSAFEGMSHAAMAAAFSHVPTLRRPFDSLPPYAVLIELSAGNAFDETQLEDRLAHGLAPFMDGFDAPVIDIAIDHRGGLWAIRHAVPEGLRASGTVIACDIAMRRGDVMRFRHHMAGILARETPGLIPHDFGHVGDGGLHYNLVWSEERGPLDPSLADRARTLVFDTVVHDFGGSFSAEHGIGPRNIAHYPRFVPAALRRLAGEIQYVMAPTPIGRVDFGMMEEA